jgi:hypothetical protein
LVLVLLLLLLRGFKVTRGDTKRNNRWAVFVLLQLFDRVRFRRAKVLHGYLYSRGYRDSSYKAILLALVFVAVSQ